MLVSHESKAYDRDAVISVRQRAEPATPTPYGPPDAALALERDLGNGYLQNAGTCYELGQASRDRQGCGVGSCRNCALRHAQTKLTVGQAGDPYEQEADRVADAVMNQQYARVALQTPARGKAAVQTKCRGCEEEDEAERLHPGGLLEPLPDDQLILGGAPAKILQCQTSAGQQGEIETSGEIVPGQGEPIAAPIRQFFESHLGYDFSGVRVHDTARAAESARSLGALAFTTSSDIVFGTGQYSPQSMSGLRLLAHELTHVVQQGWAERIDAAPNTPVSAPHGGTVAPAIQRQAPPAPAPAPPAPAPPAPAAPAPAPLLNPGQVADAITYNRMRFKDPWDIRTVRELMGMGPFPAVVDEAFVLAVAQWQTGHPPLTVDGKVGAATTQTYLVQLRADGQARLAKGLAEDNFVRTTNVGGPTYNVCPNLPGFQWDVSFDTTLRSGFIVQEVASTFDAQHCDGTPYVGPVPTLHYWEAWRVDANGNITPSAGYHDRWRRGWCNAGLGPPQCANKNSRGSWSMRGTFYTPLTLPPAANFVAGAVPDAGVLLSTTTQPNADHLGLVAGSRRRGGRWNCCPPRNTHDPT